MLLNWGSPGFSHMLQGRKAASADFQPWYIVSHFFFCLFPSPYYMSTWYWKSTCCCSCFSSAKNTIIKVWLVLCFVRKIYSPWASFDCFMPIRPLLWNAIFLLILKPTWSVLSRSTSQAGSLTLKDVMNLWLFDQVVNLIQQSFLAVGIHRKHVVVCYLIVHFVMTYA